MLAIGETQYLSYNILDKQVHEVLRQRCHSYSEGNARKTDSLMTDVLTIGAQQEQPCINAEIVMAAANNQALT